MSQEVKDLDYNLFEKIYTELHSEKSFYNNPTINGQFSFIESLIFLSRVQKIQEKDIKRIVVDIINCFEIEIGDHSHTKDRGFDEFSELINENDSRILQRLASILMTQKDSTRIMQLDAFKEELTNNT